LLGSTTPEKGTEDIRKHILKALSTSEAPSRAPHSSLLEGGVSELIVCLSFLFIAQNRIRLFSLPKPIRRRWIIGIRIGM
jgi:hypothetical protein